MDSVAEQRTKVACKRASSRESWLWMVFSYIALLVAILADPCEANPDAKRLYDDLMSSYNRLIRPVSNNSDTLTVKMSLKLSQLIDVNLKNQIMSVNVWVEQEWNDYKLRWDPEEYGGVQQLYVPAEQIWLPDIVLYNNADGNYEIVILNTKAIIHNDGRVVWNPPAIYKSSCQIDVQYFPFDEQECFMKFGSWTYDGNQVDLKHLFEVNGTNIVDLGIDLSSFYLSVEWDIMAVPATRREKFYSCCVEPYPDITFNFTLRRKTLFYTVNLIIPCVGISCLSVLVFYLPSDSGEKVSLTISILLSLTFFLLVLIEIIPSTSLSLPLLGKYLIFTMILVTFSVLVTIAILNVHFRSPSTHRMAPWVRKLFIHILPKVLLMRSPQYRLDEHDTQVAKSDLDGRLKSEFGPLSDMLGKDLSKLNGNGQSKRFVSQMTSEVHLSSPTDAEEVLIDELDSSPDELHRPSNDSGSCYPKELNKAIKNAMFIAQHIDNADEFRSIQEDWKYVAMVLDRLFLWVFSAACIIGTAGIFLQAPSIYDFSQPIDIVHSKVAKSQFEYLAEPSYDETGE